MKKERQKGMKERKRERKERRKQREKERERKIIEKEKEKGVPVSYLVIRYSNYSLLFVLSLNTFRCLKDIFKFKLFLKLMCNCCQNTEYFIGFSLCRVP
jgi:hypothetical protein